MKLVLLFTTFPVATETFLQREVRALRAAGRDLEVWSLWRGERRFEGLPIRRAAWPSLFRLLWELPFWIVREPRACGGLGRRFLRLRWRNRVNFGENLLGLGLGLAWARHLRREARQDTVLHAVWASLPATFGWTVGTLTGIPFTFAAHAYDLFENGGDGLLEEKGAAARAVRSSTRAGKARLLQAGVPEARVAVFGRGLTAFPRATGTRRPRQPVRLLAVGRCVPKMGYGRLAEVFDALHARDLPFRAEVVGSGPEFPRLAARVGEAPWSGRVMLRGSQPFAVVEQLLRWTDLVLFTGEVAASGDRAGFPNILGEAMAFARPVIATPVGAVPEAVREGQNGILATDPEAFADAIARLAADDVQYVRLATGARAWAEAQYNAHRHMEAFWDWLEAQALLS